MKPLPPLRPLPPAMVARIEAQREGEWSWLRCERWRRSGQPFENWPDLALLSVVEGTEHEFADPAEPTANELRATLRAACRRNRRH